MLTPMTQAALAVINDIAYEEAHVRSDSYKLFPHALTDILIKLEAHGILRAIDGEARGAISSYRLTRPLYQITLLDLLEATDEHLNCNHEVGEEFYNTYGAAARQLGVVNRMTRLYLAAIRLTDL